MRAALGPRSTTAWAHRSQLAGLIAAGAVAIILLFLTAPIADLPKAVLGAVIVAAAASLVDVPAWRALAETDHVELATAAVTAVLVVVTGVLEAIAFAVGLSIIDVVRRSARPHDAVLGWAPALGRYADVSVHRDGEGDPRHRRVSARRPPLLRQRRLREGEGARGAPRRTGQDARTWCLMPRA